MTDARDHAEAISAAPARPTTPHRAEAGAPDCPLCSGVGEVLLSPEWGEVGPCPTCRPQPWD